MNKKLSLLLVLPLLVTSCGKGAGFDAVKSVVDSINVSSEHPYYRVVGSIDYNSTVVEVNEVFDKMPKANEFVPYARYNEGFYNAQAQVIYDSSTVADEDIVIYMMASRSYWLRAPMKIDKTNFQVLKDNKQNSTCAAANLVKIIATWYGTVNNPSNKNPYYDLLPDGGFVVGADAIHTKFKIDNYPIYPDPDTHPDEVLPWDEDDPLPLYLTEAEGRVNIRFEYDKDGWLKREFCETVGYNYKNVSAGQFALESRYYYQNETESW